MSALKEEGPPLTRREALARERRAAAEAAGSRTGDTAAPTPHSGPVPVPEPAGHERPAPESSSGPTPPRRVTEPSPAAASSEPAAPPQEHTLTRRELRALRREREEQEAARASAGAEGARTEPGETPGGEGEPATGDASRPRGEGTSGSSTANNALILTNVPRPPATGPLTETGEVLVTGSIDLPRSLGSAGRRHSGYDAADIDAEFDRPEEATGQDAVPVRASSAVSTYPAAEAGLTAPRGARRGRLTVALVTTAAIVAAGVIGLLVVGYLMRMF